MGRTGIREPEAVPEVTQQTFAGAKWSPLGQLVWDDATLVRMMGTDVADKIPAPEPYFLSLLQAELEMQEIPSGNKCTGAEFVGKFWSPKLMGTNIRQHYEAMATTLLSPWIDAIAGLLTGPLLPLPSPEVMQQCLTLARAEGHGGWYRLTLADDCWTIVHSPLGIREDHGFADCETFVQGSHLSHPVIYTAINADAAYIWLHPLLCGSREQCINANYQPMLTPIGRGKTLVAHNAAYDRCRTEEAYDLQRRLTNAWLCTQAMHQAVSGIDADQRWAYGKKQWSGEARPIWMQHGSPKSLVASYNFHCAGELTEADKELRKVFVKAQSIQEIWDQLSPLMDYAMGDVWYLGKLFQAIFPKYRHFAPSNVVLAAHIYLLNSVLPVANDWYHWIDHVDAYCEQLRTELRGILARITEQVNAIPYEDRQEDAWFRYLPETIVPPDSCKQDAAHYLLKLTWLDRPIRLLKKNMTDANGIRLTENFGWCFPVLPSDTEFDVTFDNKRWRRLPHAKAQGLNVGGVFTDHYTQFMEKGIFGSAMDGPIAKRCIEIQHLLAYWTGTRSRIVEQSVQTVVHHRTGKAYMLCAPPVDPHNTVSLRTGQSLFLTLARSTYSMKPGSEIKAKIVPPEGDVIINFDYDSQELQIAQAFAASYAGLSGSTAVDASGLTGVKERGTDTHSLVSKSAEVCRDAGKQSVYSVLYGGGEGSVSGTICMWHPDYLMSKAKEFAKKLISKFKGVRIKGSKYFVDGLASQAFNKMLDLIATPDGPYTPMTGTKMAPAMWPAYYGQDGAPSQLNWCIS